MSTGPNADVAKIAKQHDGLVILLGLLRGDERVDLAPSVEVLLHPQGRVSLEVSPGVVDREPAGREMRGGVLYEADTLDEVWPRERPFAPYPWVEPDMYPGDDRATDYWDKIPP